MIGANSCMIIDKLKLNSKTGAEAMVEYMNKKYETKFTFLDVSGANIIMGAKKRNIIVSYKEFPNEKILVECKQMKEGEYVYSDNYVAYLL